VIREMRIMDYELWSPPTLACRQAGIVGAGESSSCWFFRSNPTKSLRVYILLFFRSNLFQS